MAKLTTNDISAEVTEKMIAAIESGNVPWRRPWQGGMSLPRSLSTGKVYGWMNTVLLWAESYASPWWGTFKAIQEAGGRISKGQKHTKVVFWKHIVKTEKDEKTGEEKKVSFPVLKFHQVFNSEQCTWEEGKNPAERDLKPLDFVPVEEAERVVQKYLSQGPSFQEKEHRAYYRPSKDLVNMPKRETFTGAEEWYSTLFHELVHSTGHASRLQREGIVDNHFFGDAEYSREELIAEMGAAFLCAATGIDCSKVFDNSAAYLRGWLKALKEDSKMVVVTAGRAQKAVGLILGSEGDGNE